MWNAGGSGRRGTAPPASDVRTPKMNTHTHPKSAEDISRRARRSGRCTSRPPLDRPPGAVVPTFLSNPNDGSKGFLGFSARIHQTLS